MTGLASSWVSPEAEMAWPEAEMAWPEAEMVSPEAEMAWPEAAPESASRLLSLWRWRSRLPPRWRSESACSSASAWALESELACSSAAAWAWRRRNLRPGFEIQRTHWHPQQ